MEAVRVRAARQGEGLRRRSYEGVGMLPSEKVERRIRRIGLTILILMALYMLVWLVGFISRIFRSAVEQRELPPEARSRVVEIA